MSRRIRELVRDIEEQATRRHRASGLKRYLVTDLEIIERRIRELKDELGRTEHGEVERLVDHLIENARSNQPVTLRGESFTIYPRRCS